MAYAFLSFQGKGGDDSLLRSVIDRSATEVVIPEGTTKIGSYCFLQYFALKKITIPNTVTHIGGYALGINSLISLEIPDSVIEIGNSAIYSCSKLESITFGKSLANIAMSNFNDLPECVLYDFTKCERVPTMGGACFKNINANAQILVPAHLYDEWVVATNWAACADYIVAVGKKYKPSEGLEYDYNEYTKSYGVVGLGDCTDTVLVIPEEHEGYPVTSIFMSDMDAVKEIVLPDTITVIMSTLQNCDALERVSFGSGVTTILYWAFNGNVNCREYDFSRCEQVPSLSFYGTEPDTFIGMHEDCRIIVPAALYEQWITATNWVTYADHIVSAT